MRSKLRWAERWVTIQSWRSLTSVTVYSNAYNVWSQKHCDLILNHWTHPFSKDISILAQERRVDNPPLVLWSLEMRIRIQEEHFLELSLVEVISEIFHRVGANACDVLVLSRVDFPQHFNAILNVVRNFNSDFHADGNLVGKRFAKADQESSVAASD